MLDFYDIKVEFECQGYKATRLGLSPDKTKSVLFFESTLQHKDVGCPKCNGAVYIHDNYQTHLTDIPLEYGMTTRWVFFGKRYKCKSCGHSFVTETPLCHPGTRITERAAAWITGLLKNKVSIRAIQDLTGIRWNTIMPHRSFALSAVYNLTPVFKGIEKRCGMDFPEQKTPFAAFLFVRRRINVRRAARFVRNIKHIF